MPQRSDAEARISVALALDSLGRPGDALPEIELAVAALTGLPRARARVQRATILRRLGRDDEAVAAYGAALAAFRRAGDRLWQARTLTDRGVLRATRGALRAAERDLLRAESLYTGLDQPAAMARVRHNLGFVAARGGDMPGAMGWYDRADEHFRRHGWPAEALMDRAELLMLARLWPEAREAAEAAAQSATRARLQAVLPKARLLQAQAALAAGDESGATAAAAAARAAFRRQGPTRWTVLADYVLWRTSATTGSVPATTWLAMGRELADRLAAAGWAEHAMEARIHAVEVATAATPTGESGPGPDEAAAATAELARAVVTVPRGPARLRARAWYGRALTRLHGGDRAGAKRALTCAARVVDAYRDTFGAAELRANVSGEGISTATLGLRLALADGDAHEVLAWAERRRAATLRLTERVRPAPEVTEHLVALRQVIAEMSTLDLHPTELTRLLRRQRSLEETVRRLTWRTPAAGSDPRRPVAEIRAGLNGNALVEFVQLDGSLTAVVVAGRRVVLRQLGSAAEVAAEAASLRFAQRRLALRHGPARSLTAARTAARHAAHRLDTLVFEPVRDVIGDRPLVLVPTGGLHGLAWPMLPTCRGRTLHVAPSASLWCSAASPPGAGHTPSGGHLLLVAAITPPHAAAEVARIGGGHPDATVLTGARARVPDVLSALDGARVAHLAAHGRFRADNPLFSQLSLADGPLTVHDMFNLRRPPELLVLSACDAGLSSVRDGDELMGFTSSVLGLGTQAVVASVGPVDDESTVGLMVDLHRRLHAGAAPAEALAAAQVATDADPYASTNGFVCFGAG